MEGRVTAFHEVGKPFDFRIKMYMEPFLRLP